MLKTGIVRDERYKNHVPGDFHPESPERLDVVYSMLEEPDMSNKFQEVEARIAGRDELLLIHSAEYIEKVKTNCCNIFHISFNSQIEKERQVCRAKRQEY